MAGNPCDLLTITTFSDSPEKIKQKKGIGMGLASKLAEKKKEILGAKRGKFAKSGPRSEFGAYNKMRDMMDS